MGTSIQWIDDRFPGAVGKYRKTSEATEDYNCIAWAAGDNASWWSHATGYKWPGAKRSHLIESLVAVFEHEGYQKCDNGELEDGFEKVALYAKGRLWQHASLQLETGKWTTKLGDGEDCESGDAECWCGADYGQIHCYMKRRRSDDQENTKPAQ